MTKYIPISTFSIKCLVRKYLIFFKVEFLSDKSFIKRLRGFV